METESQKQTIQNRLLCQTKGNVQNPAGSGVSIVCGFHYRKKENRRSLSAEARQKRVSFHLLQSFVGTLSEFETMLAVFALRIQQAVTESFEVRMAVVDPKYLLDQRAPAFDRTVVYPFLSGKKEGIDDLFLPVFKGIRGVFEFLKTGKPAGYNDLVQFLFSKKEIDAGLPVKKDIHMIELIRQREIFADLLRLFLGLALG